MIHVILPDTPQPARARTAFSMLPKSYRVKSRHSTRRKNFASAARDAREKRRPEDRKAFPAPKRRGLLPDGPSAGEKDAAAGSSDEAPSLVAAHSGRSRTTQKPPGLSTPGAVAHQNAASLTRRGAVRLFRGRTPTFRPRPEWPGPWSFSPQA